MIIENGIVFADNKEFIKRNITITNNVISAISDECSVYVSTKSDTYEETLDASDCYVIPGLIDIHFHGANGADFSDKSTEAIEKLLEYELSNGVTSVCPTTMSYDSETLNKILRVTNKYMANHFPYNKKGAYFAGVNLEGPFLNPQKCGAQNKKYLSNPDISLFKTLINDYDDLIKAVNISPELPNAMEFIDKYKDVVRISLGHTDCSYETAQDAFSHGASGLTHMGNAMNPMLSRMPGPIPAALENNNISVELITDGVHIHPSMINIFFKLFGDNRIIMISDSMRACGLSDGIYDLGGQKVYVKDKRATLEDSTIAGSVCNLMDCFKKAVKEFNLPLESAIKCSTFNPAKAIGIHSKTGSISIGKTADLLILNKNLEIKHIIKG